MWTAPSIVGEALAMANFFFFSISSNYWRFLFLCINWHDDLLCELSLLTSHSSDFVVYLSKSKDELIQSLLITSPYSLKRYVDSKEFNKCTLNTHRLT